MANNEMVIRRQLTALTHLLAQSVIVIYCSGSSYWSI